MYYYILSSIVIYYYIILASLTPLLAWGYIGKIKILNQIDKCNMLEAL